MMNFDDEQFDFSKVDSIKNSLNKEMKKQNVNVDSFEKEMKKINLEDLKNAD